MTQNTIPAGRPAAATRFPIELLVDDFGDRYLNAGYYGISQPGSWSVQTGFSPLGKDLGYWARVVANAAVIDDWMAEHRPGRSTRLKVDFVGNELHIRDYDWDAGPPLGVVAAADRS